MSNLVHKTYLKTWVIGGFYQYKIYEIDAGGVKWLQADPVTMGACRTANTEEELKILLNNDAMNLTNFYKKVR